MIINPYIFAGNTLNNNVRNAWNFDNAVSDSIGGVNATLMNGCTYTSSGKMGQALTFDGVNDYATFADDSLNLTGDFTISIWLYPVTGVAQNLLNNRAFTSGSINKGWGLGINNISGAQTSKVTWVQPIGPATTQYTGWEYRTTSLTLNAWNHILIYRVSGVNTYCEVNGILQSPTIFGTGANVTLDPTYHTTQKNSLGALITLAGAVSNYTPANTKVDALTIWNRTLTTTEKNDLYNAGAGKQYLFI